MSSASAPLRRFVHRYRYFSYAGHPAGVSHAIPTRHLTVMISLSDQITVLGTPAESFRAFAAGLQTAPAVVADHGHGCGVAIDITPLGARALLGMPASQIAGDIVGLDQVWGTRVNALAEQLASVTSWASRVAILDRSLLASSCEPTEPPRAISAAWDQLTDSAGTVKVGVLAGRVGLCRRQLSDQFRAEYGFSPKQAGRVFRFERAANLLVRSRRRSLAEVAGRSGYFDQAHLTNEWHALAGMTPTQWLATETKDPFDEHPAGCP